MGRPIPPPTPPHAVMTSMGKYFYRGHSVVFNELQDKQIIYICRQISGVFRPSSGHLTVTYDTRTARTVSYVSVRLLDDGQKYRNMSPLK